MAISSGHRTLVLILNSARFEELGAHISNQEIEVASRSCLLFGASLMVISRLIAALTLSMTTSACVVFPMRNDTTPAVSGVLLDNGLPVANAEIVLTDRFPRVDETAAIPEDANRATTRTDADGRFQVGPLWEVQMMHPLFGDPFYAYALIITVGDKRYLGFSDGITGTVRNKLAGTCDITKPQKTPDGLVYCDHNLVKKL